MKKPLCLLAILALAPVVAQAQSNSSYENLKSEVLRVEMERAARENAERENAAPRGTRGPIFSLPKYGKMFTGKTGKERRAERESKADAAAHDGWVRYPGGYRGKDGQIKSPDGTITGHKRYRKANGELENDREVNIRENKDNEKHAGKGNLRVKLDGTIVGEEKKKAAPAAPRALPTGTINGRTEADDLKALEKVTSFEKWKVEREKEQAKGAQPTKAPR